MWCILKKKPVAHLSSVDKCRKWENRPFVHAWPEPNAVQVDTNKPKKTSKRIRTAFTTMQIKYLEKVFDRFKYVDSKLRAKIASFLKISDKTVKVWFQNRRMKEKRESSEANSSVSEVSHSSVSQDASVTHDQLDYVNLTNPHNYSDIPNVMNYNYAACNNNELMNNQSSFENRNSIYSLESESYNENYNIPSHIKSETDFVQNIYNQTESADIQDYSYTEAYVPNNESSSVPILQQSHNVLLGFDEEAFKIPPRDPTEQYFIPYHDDPNMYANFYVPNNDENAYEYSEKSSSNATYYNFN